MIIPTAYENCWAKFQRNLADSIFSITKLHSNLVHGTKFNDRKIKDFSNSIFSS